MVSAQEFEYEQPGRFEIRALDPVQVQLYESGCDQEAGVCDATVNAIIPEPVESGPFPLAILSNGFMLTDDQYESYARHLASYGYITIRWTLAMENALLYPRHRQRGAMVNVLIDWADSQYGNLVDTTAVLVWGHSAGGKSSTLAAAADDRIVGLVGVDPVDCPPPFQVVGPDFPLSALQLRNTRAKSLWLGAQYGPDTDPFGQACAPGECNFPLFHGNATNSWEVEFQNTGHMQFLDNRAGALPALFCKTGPDGKDAIANRVTKALTVAMAEHTIRGRNIDLYTGGYMRQLADQGDVRFDIKGWGKKKGEEKKGEEEKVYDAFW